MLLPLVPVDHRDFRALPCWQSLQTMDVSCQLPEGQGISLSSAKLKTNLDKLTGPYRPRDEG